MNLKDIIAEIEKEFDNQFAAMYSDDDDGYAYKEVKKFLSLSIEKACKEYAKAVVEEATPKIQGTNLHGICDEEPACGSCREETGKWKGRNQVIQSTLKRAGEIIGK